MKKLFVILTLLCFGAIQAQPQKINYQAVAVNASGVTVKNRVISLRLSILDSNSTGSVLYSETHQPTTDGSGQFSVYLGGGTAVSGTFSNISWGNTKDKFLKAEADLNGGTNYVLMGVSQVVSVPYAISTGGLKEGATITGSDGRQYTITVGANGPVWNLTNPNAYFNCGQSVNYAGENYPTVQIGPQCWFQKNLNVGTMTPPFFGDQTNNSIIEKYCYADFLSNCTTFGGLYQWAEAMNYQSGASLYSGLSIPIVGNVQGICPSGWHLPTDAEWCFLSLFLDSAVNCNVIYNWTGNDVGGKMKSSSTLWAPNNVGATNVSGFSALPGGWRGNLGPFTTITFNQLNVFAGFWSVSEASASTGLMRYFDHSVSQINRNNYPKYYGLSIRCLKD
jgi:uncharacterized protein (TIGR02145 family)